MSNKDAPPNGFKPTEIGPMPDEWDTTALADESTFEFMNGLWKGEKLPLVRARVIRNTNFNNDGTIDYSDVAELEIEQRAFEKKQLKRGDIIIERSGGGPKQPVGRVVHFDRDDDDFSFSNFTSCLRIKTPETVQSKFLLYYLLNFHMQGNTESLQKRTTGIRNLDFGDYKKTPVPLPPLPEQRAIAHVLSKIQAAAQAQAAIAGRARELKRALMAKLFTEGLRGEPLKETEIGVMPEGWETVKLADVSEFLQYGTSERCDTEPDGIPVLRIPNVIDGKIDISDLKYLKSPKKTSLKLKLEVGDVIFVRTNGRREYVGRCAVFNNELEEALFASYLIRARLKPDSLWPEFFQMYSMTEKGREFLSGKASNAADGKFNINTQTLKAVLLPLPPLDEQRDVARVLRTVDAKIAAAERKRAGLEELFRAMLGELMTGRVRVKGQTNQAEIV